MRHPPEQRLLEAEGLAPGRGRGFTDEGVALVTGPFVEERDDALLGADGADRALDHRLHHGLDAAGATDLRRQLVQHGELLDGPAEPLVLLLEGVRVAGMGATGGASCEPV